MNKPLVTVIIPTYNRERYIERAIESVISQKYTNIEIIVVDDGSTDSTSTLVEKYTNVIYISQPHKGQGTARNNGLKHASGVYIASLDSDDFWHPDFLSICIEKLESDSLDFVFANWLQDSGKGEFINHLDVSEALRKFSIVGHDWLNLDNEQLRNIYVADCPSPSSSLVINYNTLIVNGWAEDFLIADDWCMIMDIVFRKNASAAFTPKLLWTKNRVGTNVYDGQSSFEIAESLRIKDASLIYNRFAGIFSAEEKVIFKRAIAISLLFHAYHELKFRKRFFKSLFLFRKAIAINGSGVVSKLFQKLVVKTVRLTYISSSKK